MLGNLHLKINMDLLIAFIEFVSVKKKSKGDGNLAGFFNHAGLVVL